MEDKNTAAECPHCGYQEGTPPREKYHMVPGILLHGKYTVGKVLGYGGFGVTYIGWDQSLRRKVAIKEFLPGELATRMPGETMVRVFEKTVHQFEFGLQRFVEEAQCLAKFNHVISIVDVYDVFIENNTGYFVMEYLEGDDVKALIQKNGSMPYESARLIISDILKTLAEVHREGILHRDISPDNIFITTDNRIKLLDFGAARYATDTFSEKLSIILKPGYAPEEQYRRHGEQGSWSDVYAVAATFYKMLTGITPPESIERLRKDTLKSPLELGVSIPLGANTALMRAMNVQAKKRTYTAEDFLWELERTRVVAPAVSDAVLKEERKPVKPQKEDGKTPIAVVLIVIMAAIVLAGVLIWTLPSLIPVSSAAADVVDTGLKMSYYMDALTTDELTFYAGEEDAEESDLIDKLKDKSHPEYRYDNIEKAETVFLKIPKPEKGYTITVTVNGKSLSPMKELPENVSADYDYFKIKVTDKTDVSVKQEYVHFAILGIKINTTSSTYNFTCSKKLFAKLAGITYSIDGGIEQLIPDFDGDVKTYFIREKIPATAERLMIYAVPEDGAYRVTYHPAKIVAIRAEEGKQVPVTMQVTVEDPAGSAEESTYELNFIVEEKEPPRQVEVPAVQGKTFGKAKSVLEAAGLEFRVITEPTDDKRQDDIVIFSNPDAGEEVDPGSTVTVVVWEYKALPTPHPAPTREPTPKPTAPPTATPSETPWATPWAAPAGHPAETLRAAPAE